MDWLLTQQIDASVLSNRIILIVAMTCMASAAPAALSMMTVGGDEYAVIGAVSAPLAVLALFLFTLPVAGAPASAPHFKG